jgi:methenyltetrahydromethanopterin cyclohydrolase
MISLNGQAARIVQRMIDEAEALGLVVQRYPSGATVVDAGVAVPGSLEAGRLFAEVCMGGLGQVQFCVLEFSGVQLPGVKVVVSRPPLACVAAQFAGWPVKGGESGNRYQAMGSGPARALRGEEELYERLGYWDESDVAVLALEAGQLPPEEVVEEIADACHVSPDHLYLVVASIASLAGSVQVAARVVEAGMHKMVALGFDVRTVISASGTCPLAPVAEDAVVAIGRANDAVLYGGQAWYTVRAEDGAIEAVVDQLPSCASRDYGASFYELFQRYGCDFYSIDPLLFSVAELSIHNVTSGRTFTAGAVNGDMVRRSLLG